MSSYHRDVISVSGVGECKTLGNAIVEQAKGKMPGGHPLETSYTCLEIKPKS